MPNDDMLERLAVAEFNGWVSAGILYPWCEAIEGIDTMDLGEAVPAIVAFYKQTEKLESTTPVPQAPACVSCHPDCHLCAMKESNNDN